MKKRLFSMALCLCMVLTMLPTMAIPALAATTDVSDEASLKAAFNDPADGSIIKLTQSIALSAGLECTVSHSVTLDLNGNTLSTSGTASTLQPSGGGSLTIDDTSTGKIGEISSTIPGGSTIIPTNVSITLHAGTISNSGGYGDAIRGQSTNSPINIEGGTVLGTIQQYNGGTINIYGGAVKSALRGINGYNSDSKPVTINIYGGEVIGEAFPYDNYTFPGISGNYNYVTINIMGPAVVKGTSQAIAKLFTIASGYIAMASESVEGTNLVSYSATDNDKYKYIQTMAAYNATVSVQKDGAAWTEGAPTITLQNGTETAIAATTTTDNVSTFNSLGSTVSYKVLANGIDTGKTVSSGSAALTLDYYTVTLNAGTGIASVSGGGTYLKDKTATIGATLTSGYAWAKWSDDNTTQTNRALTVSAKIDLTASATLIPATAPTVSVTGAELTYGYASGGVSVTATAASGHTITGYQWYSNSSSSNSGGTLISGATSASYALGTGKAVGTTEYYYCVVTSTRTDNSQTANATSGVATVTVGKADGSGGVSIDDWTYGGTTSTPTPVSATNGTGSVTYSYEGTGSTNYTASATAPTNAGTYQVTATFAATDSYNGCTATDTFTIAPQPVAEPTADTTSFVYNGSEQTYTLTENTLYTIAGNERTHAGEQTVTAAIKDKANYIWATSNDTTDLTFTFTIAKAPVSFVVSGNTHDYDAAAHTATVTQTVSETPPAAGCFTVSYQKGTEPATANETTVGVYKIIVTLDSDNFKFAGQEDAVRSLALTDKLTISAVAYPDAGSLTLPTAGSLTYGAKLSDSALTGGDAGCTYAWKTGTTIPTVTNTGYAVVCTPNDTNYAPFEKTVSIAVSKATPTLTLPTAGAITYGQTLESSAFTGGSASATYNAVANTDVPGTYTWKVKTTAPQVSDSNVTMYEVTFTPTDTANYNINTGSVKLTVNSKPVELTWDYTTPFTYDGAAKTVSATVNNKIGEDTFTLIYSDNNKTNAGSYTAKVTALGNDNYTLTGGTNVSKEWGIQKAPISFAVTDNSYTYDAAAHKVTVVQTASETTKIDASKFAVTHKLPADSSGTADKTNVGTYDIIVTLSDDNFCFVGETDESTRSHTLTDKLTITKNTVTALWKNTITVYDGTAQSPEFELVGLKAADTGVTARLTESKTNADTYAVTAELTGTSSGNYTLTNPNSTFIIQRAPVSFTLTGNSVKKGENVNVIASPSVNGISAALTYWQSGKQVAVPTEMGSYDVYAEITNPNYRHAGGTDGTAQKIGVLTIYESITPAAYTVTFDANGGNGSTASMDAVQAGTVRVLPESGFTGTGKVFAGWQYGTKTYQPGECFTQPASNVTLKALWNDKVYSIGGIVQESNPVSNAANVVVTLMLGSWQIGQTVTDADGTYSFADVVPGVYNLVASKDGVTQTVMVTIKDKEVTDQTITMPTGKLSSVVEVKAGSPAIVVGDLEKAFTQQDKTDAASKTVELRLTAQAKAADSANSVQQAIEKKAGSVDLFLDFSLTKTVDDTSSPLDSSPVLLTAVITLPAALQGKDSYTVYRYHGTEVQALTTTANTDGEKIEVSKDKTTLTVYTKNFSAYAIKGVTYSGGGVSNYTITVTTGDGGSISPSGNVSVTKGSSKAFAITPDTGYVISDVLVDGASVGAVSSYTFSDVTAAHTLSAVFATATGLPYYLDGSGNKVFIGFATEVDGEMKYIAPEGAAVHFTPNPKSFTDISGHWAEPYISFVTERELFLGTGENSFSPDAGMTRAMFATVIGRLYERSYGEISTASAQTFTDCDYAAYYGKYITWAAENGIIGGYGNGKFGPNDQITREQMAAILYRFADFLSVLPGGMDTALTYPDAASISAYAKDAALYCQSTGIITGRTGGVFAPQETATRAEVSAIIERFIGQVVK